MSVIFYECSNQHVPGFITQAEELKAKGVDEILLVSGMLSAFFLCVHYIMLWKQILSVIFADNYFFYLNMDGHMKAYIRYFEFLVFSV